MSDNPAAPEKLLMTPIDATLFRQTMSRYASGVTIVTVMDEAGTPWGLTANAVSSVSLHPPLVLVCIDKKANTYEAVTKASSFAMNFLNGRQDELALLFATRGADKFAGVSYQLGVTGAPLLPEVSLAVIECRTFAQYPGGDHTIVVGEVVTASLGEGQPLLFYDRKFGTFVANPPHPSGPPTEPDPWALDYF
jgi:flavin reductase ActVB